MGPYMVGYAVGNTQEFNIQKINEEATRGLVFKRTHIQSKNIKVAANYRTASRAISQKKKKPTRQTWLSRTSTHDAGSFSPVCSRDKSRPSRNDKQIKFSLRGNKELSRSEIAGACIMARHTHRETRKRPTFMTDGESREARATRTCPSGAQTFPAGYNYCARRFLPRAPTSRHRVVLLVRPDNRLAARYFLVVRRKVSGSVARSESAPSRGITERRRMRSPTRGATTRRPTRTIKAERRDGDLEISIEGDFSS